jgi:outer membrane receptor protein involved in Fe transport
MTYAVSNRLKLLLNHTYNGQFYDSSIPTSLVQMPSYNRFDFRIKWQALENLEIGLMGDNIFNSGYEEAIGFSNPGRQYRVSMRVDL